MKTAIKVLCYIAGALSIVALLSVLFVSTTAIRFLIDVLKPSIEGEAASHADTLITALTSTVTIFGLSGSAAGIFFSFFIPSRIDKATCKKDVIVWGVLSIFFVNIIVAILIFCLTDEDFKKEPKVEVIDVTK